MTDSQSRSDWRACAPRAIPTKHDLTQLEAWLETLPVPSCLLDLGCGTGQVSAWLLDRGHAVTGLDINPAAIAQAQTSLPGVSFAVADIAAANGLQPPDALYDGVVVQLVLSVIGDAADRHQLLRNAFAVLKPGGSLYLSASGTSDDINTDYAHLYATDAAVTGEPFTYLSRDAAGQVLYRTHHFNREELRTLLQEAGYTEIAISERIEASSRRPEQRARFFYLSAQRPHDHG